MHSPPASIEVQETSPPPSLPVVGLAEPAVREAKDRVRSAVTPCGFHWAPGSVTVDLAQADLTKDVALEATPEPLKSGRITISRAAGQRVPGKSG